MVRWLKGGVNSSTEIVIKPVHIELYVVKVIEEILDILKVVT
jgi:hypothetical protein